jgi:hypothetical protein
MKEITKPGSVRLPVSVLAKLRALMRHYGSRDWLVKIINREHRKVLE